MVIRSNKLNLHQSQLIFQYEKLMTGYPTDFRYKKLMTGYPTYFSKRIRILCCTALIHLLFRLIHLHLRAVLAVKFEYKTQIIVKSATFVPAVFELKIAEKNVKNFFLVFIFLGHYSCFILTTK